MQRLFLIIAACLALLLAGCGDDSSTDSTTAGGADTTAESPQSEESPQAEEEAEKEAGEEAASGGKPKVNVPSGPPPKKLETKDLKQGSGATAKAGDAVSVQYVGVLYDGGQEFDNSWERGEPFTFTLGAGEVISGWDQGVQGMKVGGRRELIIPPDLAYGDEGIYPSIPPKSTLVFVVDLVDVK